MKPLPSDQKLRGGYYTPKPIADFLAQWAIRSPGAKVLEPSCGDGIFIKSALATLLRMGVSSKEACSLIQGVEIDPEEAAKAREHFVLLGPFASERIRVGDFFSFCKAQLAQNNFFDAIIGNPPFIRYQNFLEEYRVPAFELMQQAGLHPNRLINSWVPFLVASSLLLSDHGRMAMIIPAELFQVNYAAETRQFLSDFYRRITIITFERLVFEGIQQEVVLLLCERDGCQEEGIRVIELKDIDDLSSYIHTDFSSSQLKQMDHSTEKWIQYFLEKEEIDLLRRLRGHPKLTPSGKVIDVDVGIVTGQNDFFVLTQDQVAKHSLGPYTQRIVSRSAQLRGAVFSDEDWKENFSKQAPAVLFKAPDLPYDELPNPVKDYIKQGEEKGFNKGYKCRIRKHWYIVPSLWTPQAFMLRQVHGYPKLILNEAQASCTDTVHRVNFINGSDHKAVVLAFLNSLTFAFAEVTGRSYGGGVLTFEPSESERLPIPLFGVQEIDLKKIDKLLRENNITAILDITDQMLLKRGLGLSSKDIKMIRNIWQKLSYRRINRKYKRAAV